MVYNPEQWFESTVREIEAYVSGGFQLAVRDENGNPAGLEIYEIVMEFPGPALDNQDLPMTKTVIHFEVDDHVASPVGLGENVFADNYSAGSGPGNATVNPQYAEMHTLNFDVGIWASAESGGTTSRLRAMQILDNLFGAPSGKIAFQTVTDGGDGRVEILSYSGGRFILDTINDVPVYRMIDATLSVRVYSRTPLSDTPGAAIETINQDPNLSITESPNPIILG